VPRFPAIERDIAFVLDAGVPAAYVLASLSQAADTRVSGIKLFDQFRPQKATTGMAETEKSLAFRVVMQDTEKTLTDAEADEIIALLVSAVVKKHQGRLRA
jgi:phenylalanyl-tRNA synthetase beta chain